MVFSEPKIVLFMIRWQFLAKSCQPWTVNLTNRVSYSIITLGEFVGYLLLALDQLGHVACTEPSLRPDNSANI